MDVATMEAKLVAMRASGPDLSKLPTLPTWKPGMRDDEWAALLQQRRAAGELEVQMKVEHQRHIKQLEGEIYAAKALSGTPVVATEADYQILCEGFGWKLADEGGDSWQALYRRAGAPKPPNRQAA